MKKKGKKKNEKTRTRSKSVQPKNKRVTTNTKTTNKSRKKNNKYKIQSSSKKTKTSRSKIQRNKKKKQEKRYNNWLVEFTALRTYDYNRPSELETFVRSIPTGRKITRKGFQNRYLQWVKEEEFKVFEKIAEDTDNAVTWSSWVISFRHQELAERLK